MIEKLREKARELLQNETVKVVIGYTRDKATNEVGPVFVTKPDDCEKLIFDDDCTQNLVTFLNRKEAKKLGKPAIVVRDTGARAAVVLCIESQVKREDVVLLGMVAGGHDDASLPKLCDEVFGEPPTETADSQLRYQKLQKLTAMSPPERLEYWKKELARCVKCYACRQVCPLCYCNRCIVEKNQPQQIVTSPSLRGNFAWQIVRSFHLAGRCTGCGACARACPVGIDLDLLNLTLAKAAEDEFGFRSGLDLDAEPLVGNFNPDDQENFIG